MSHIIHTWPSSISSYSSHNTTKICRNCLEIKHTWKKNIQLPLTIEKRHNGDPITCYFNITSKVLTIFKQLTFLFFYITLHNSTLSEHENIYPSFG